MIVSRMLSRLFTNVDEPKPARRREWVASHPTGEHLESRALQSALKPGVAMTMPAGPGNGVVVVHVKAAPAISVTYQPPGVGTDGDDVVDPVPVENDVV